MKRGEPWKRLVYDESKKGYVQTEPIVAAPEHEAEIISSITQLHTKLNQATQQRNTLAETFNTRHKSDYASVQAAEDKFFPPKADEKK